MRKLRRRRRWLETLESEVDSYWTSSVSAPRTKEEREEGWHFREMSLRIADCNRHIDLDFSYNGEKGRILMLDKLDRLQAGLDEIRIALEEDMP